MGELGYVIPTDGAPEFRTEIAERYNRDTEDVVLTCGTQETDFLTFMSLLSEEDHTVVVSPAYQSLAPEYVTTIKLWFSRIEDIDTLPGGGNLEPSEAESRDEPNGYDGDSRSEN